jgi:hypothetical protein
MLPLILLLFLLPLGNGQGKAESSTEQQTAARPSIHGRVLDSSEEPLPGVEVTLEDVKTGVKQLVITDPTGRYQFGHALDGQKYNLIFQLQGFITERMENFTYRSPFSVKLNRQLTIDPAVWEIEVYANAQEQNQTSPTHRPLILVKEARHLVNLALPEKTKRLPGLTLWLSEEDEVNPPKCLTFDVIWSNPGPGSYHVGFWSVDRRTGEVWTPMLCKRVINKSLRVAQQSIRKRLGATDSEYQAALKNNPCCNLDSEKSK